VSDTTVSASGAKALLACHGASAAIGADDGEVGGQLVREPGQDPELERRAERRGTPGHDEEDFIGWRRLELGSDRREIVVGVKKDQLLRAEGTR
jgi:hypothetical protein